MACDGRQKDLNSLRPVWSHKSDWPNVTGRYPTFKDLFKDVFNNIKDQMKHHMKAAAKGGTGQQRAEDADADGSGSGSHSSGAPEDGDSSSNWMDIQPAPGTTRTTQSSTEKRAVEVLNSYKSYAGASFATDSCLSWWKENAFRFPELADVARRRLSTQASSACSERSFSKAGLIVTKKRMMLTPEHVDAASLVGWCAAEEGATKVRRREAATQGPKRKKRRGACVHSTHSALWIVSVLTHSAPKPVGLTMISIVCPYLRIFVRWAFALVWTKLPAVLL